MSKKDLLARAGIVIRDEAPAEPTAAERFWRHPDLVSLRYVPKPEQTSEMARAAMDAYDGTGEILRFVSKRLQTRELCLEAISKNGWNLRYVPKALAEDRAFCLEAVRANGSALRWVPKGLVDVGIARAAVEGEGSGSVSLEDIPREFVKSEGGRELCEAAVHANPRNLPLIPSKWATKALVRETLARNPSLCPASFVPARHMTKELARRSIELDPLSIGRIPEKLLTEKLVDRAVEQEPATLALVPDRFKKKEPFHPEFERNVRPTGHADPAGLPEELLGRDREPARNLEQERALAHAKPSDPSDGKVVSARPGLSRPRSPLLAPRAATLTREPVHHLGETHAGVRGRVLYVSDVHLEHQLGLEGKTIGDARGKIREHLQGMLEDMHVGPGNLLLVGGDVADDVDLVRVFFEELQAATGRLTEADGQGPMPTGTIAVLGNHELWAGSPKFEGPGPTATESLIGDYKAALGPLGVTVLENALYVRYRGLRDGVLEEEDLSEASDSDLSAVCDDATFLCLGGIGFAGRNARFNANAGLYLDVVGRGEEKARTARFRAAYEKVVRCAGRRPVVVLTHMPMGDWTAAEPHGDWAYVSGHTHTNSALMTCDGALMLSDGQFGYRPRRWRMRELVTCVPYEPLSELPDGINEISRRQYREFNLAQGIDFGEFNRSGSVLALKSGGTYMFVLKTPDKTYLLAGGAIRNLGHEPAWYLPRMEEYARRVKEALRLYQEALDRMAHEVRSLGGVGRTHGCIVDFDYFHHLYVNPYDGTVTPYYAEDTRAWLTFRSIRGLIAHSRSMGLRGSLAAGEVTKALEGGKAPTLARGGKNRPLAAAKVPRMFLETSVAYRPSNALRQLQYAVAQNVIRVWRDEVLDGPRLGKDGSPPSSHALPS